MNVMTAVSRIELFIDVLFATAENAYFSCFLFLHKYIFMPLQNIDSDAWTYFTAFNVGIWLSSFRLSRILPCERTWELFLIRICLAKIIQISIPASIFIWYSSILFYAGKKLPEYLFAYTNQYLYQHKEQFLHGSVAGFALALLLVLLIGKKIEPALAGWFDNRTQLTSKNNNLRNVDVIFQYLPKQKAFDPAKYFKASQQINSIFTGLQANKEVLSLDRGQFSNSNVLVIGPTRTGKGVLSGVVLSQCLGFHNPDIVIAIDPKGDDWGPLVLKKACANNQLPFNYINLQRGQQPQFNPLLSATKEELIPLLTAAYDLAPKGSPDDYYRQIETEAVELIVSQCSDTPTFKELYSLALQLFEGKELDNIRSLISKLRQDANLSALDTVVGPKFDELLKTGGVFWFVGSEDDAAIIRMQRLIAVRAVQFFRNRNDKSRHGTIFADELKHVLSSQFYKAFATIIGAGNANILATIQTKGDLVDIPVNLNPEAVSKTIFDNCAIKWFYRTKDNDTVEWIINSEGTKTYNSVRQNTERNMELSETSSSSRTLVEEELPYLHRNQILHLPDACAVIIGIGLAKIAFVSPVRVKKETLYPAYLPQEDTEFIGNSVGDKLL